MSIWRVRSCQVWQPFASNKFLVIRQTSTAANKICLQWAVRPSTAHRSQFCRALYLQPSNKKLGLSRDKGPSLAPSSLPRMGMYAEYTPIRVNFDLAPNLTPSDKKLGATLKVRISLVPSDCYAVGIMGIMGRLGKIPTIPIIPKVPRTTLSKT